MPYIDFTAGDILTAAQMDTTHRQGVMTFASAAARDSALTGVLDEGMTVYHEDDNSFHFYTGSAWKPLLTQWTAWTPVWTHVTVTGATNTGLYRYVGGSLEIKVRLTAGSGTVIGSAGIPNFRLPNSETATSDGVRNLGTTWYLDATSTDYVGTCQCNAGSTNVFLYTINVGGLSDTSPFTWAITDSIDVNISVRVT